MSVGILTEMENYSAYELHSSKEFTTWWIKNEKDILLYINCGGKEDYSRIVYDKFFEDLTCYVAINLFNPPIESEIERRGQLLIRRILKKKYRCYYDRDIPDDVFTALQNLEDMIDEDQDIPKTEDQDTKSYCSLQ